MGFPPRKGGGNQLLINPASPCSIVRAGAAVDSGKRSLSLQAYLAAQV
jgi:hypothetical protein